jgi:hypothetical protein
MCEQLVQACEGATVEPRETCFEIGAAGLKNPRDEDRCYAAYDDCLPECLYFQGASDDAGDAAATLTDAAVVPPVPSEILPVPSAVTDAGARPVVEAGVPEAGAVDAALDAALSLDADASSPDDAAVSVGSDAAVGDASVIDGG